jgi:hypothetical protein
MRRISWIAVPCLLLAAPAFAEDFKATLYPQGKREPVLYTHTQAEQRSGDAVTTVRRAYFDPTGKEVAVEEVTLDGGKVKTFRLDHKQLNEQGSLEVKDGRLYFSYTAEGKTKRADEAMTADFVIAPLLIGYLHAGWKDLMAGQTLKARLAVLDRRETVGFQSTKTGEGTVNGKAVVHVQMKPSSFLIAALVKPIRLTLEKDSQRVVEYSGRAVPRQWTGSKYETLDADVVYTY